MTITINCHEHCIHLKELPRSNRLMQRKTQKLKTRIPRGSDPVRLRLRDEAEACLLQRKTATHGDTQEMITMTPKATRVIIIIIIIIITLIIHFVLYVTIFEIINMSSSGSNAFGQRCLRSFALDATLTRVVRQISCVGFLAWAPMALRRTTS